MDNELKRLLTLLMNRGALVNGLPTSVTFDSTTDSLEYLSDVLRTGIDTSGIAAALQGSITARLEGLRLAIGVVAAGAATGYEIDGAPSVYSALGIISDAAVTPDGASGTIHAKLRGLGTRWVGSDTSGTFTVTNAMGTVEQDITELAKTNRYGVSIYLDLNALVAAVEGGTVTVRYYNKIDEVTYRVIGSSSFVVGTTTTHPSVEVIRLNHNTKFSIQMGTAVSANRAIPWRYILQDLE